MIQIDREGSRAVIHPSGDAIVAATLAELRLTMRQAVEAGVRDLTVDLGAVRMVDSSGIGLLIAAHNSLRKAGGRIAVVHVSTDLLELFRTMRMHQHFQVTGRN